MSSSSPLNPRLQDAVAGHDAKSGVGGLPHAAGTRHGEHALIERGYVPVRQLTGKVVGVWGDAHIRLLDGQVVPLHVGDVVKKGEVILTAQDGIIQIEASHIQVAGASASDLASLLDAAGQGAPGSTQSTYLLAHAHHHALVPRAAHDGREHRAGGIVSGEASLVG